MPASRAAARTAAATRLISGWWIRHCGMSTIRCDPSWNRPIFGVRVRPRTMSRARWRLAKPGASTTRGRGQAGARGERGERVARARRDPGLAVARAPGAGRSVRARRGALTFGNEDASVAKRVAFRASGRIEAWVLPPPSRCAAAPLALALLAAVRPRAARRAAGRGDRAPARAGPHAITECAAAQHRRGRADSRRSRATGRTASTGSTAELGVRAVRPVFRRADGHPLADAARGARGARARAARRAPDARRARRCPRCPSSPTCTAGARRRAPTRRRPPRVMRPTRTWCGRSASAGGRARPRRERSVPRVERILGPALPRPVGNPARPRARGVGPLAGRGDPGRGGRHRDRHASTPTSPPTSG